MIFMQRYRHALLQSWSEGQHHGFKPWSATAGANTPCNAVSNRPGCNVVLLWMAANAGYRTPRYLTFKQALELGGNVRKGEHGTKVYFVKQLQVADPDGEEGKTRIVPMMREYTVFNVDQCDGLPDRVLTLGEVKVRNTEERDPTIDSFMACSGATIREGFGKLITDPAMTSSACHASKPSRAPRIFMELRSTSVTVWRLTTLVSVARRLIRR